MSTEYIKTSWQDGDIITADKMNNIENGIKDVEDTTSALKEDLTAVEDNVADVKEDISSMQTATSEDVGKVLKAKTVSGGKVTEWEFGNAGGIGNYELPILNLYGDISSMTKDVKATLAYEYVDNNTMEQRAGWLTCKWQGETSTAFPKKNFNLVFYHDALVSRKDKIEYMEDCKESKWTAKANYIDHSQARNIVSARLWSGIVKSRHSAPPALLKDSPRYGAIDGYPIVIYINNAYQGLYTLNIKKDDFTFGMDEDNPLHCAICGDVNNDGDNTRTLSTEFRSASTNGWEIEVPSAFTADTSAGLVALINFVMSSTDADFYANLNDYLDVESAIDYFIFTYFVGAYDNLARNLVLLTYDGGTKWYCSAYDLDCTFGMTPHGGLSFPSTGRFQADYAETNSLLWERMAECFGNEIYARYLELRDTVLNLSYINREFTNFINSIPKAEYVADVNKWTSIPNKTSNGLEFILNFISERAAYADVEIARLATSTAIESVDITPSSLTFSKSVAYTPNPTYFNTPFIVDSDFEQYYYINGTTHLPTRGNSGTDWTTPQIQDGYEYGDIILNPNGHQIYGACVYDENDDYITNVTGYAPTEKSHILPFVKYKSLIDRNGTKCALQVRSNNANGINVVKPKWNTLDSSLIPSGSGDVYTGPLLEAKAGAIVLIRCTTIDPTTTAYYSAVCTYASQSDPANSYIAKFDDVNQKVHVVTITGDTANYVGFKLNRAMINEGGTFEYVVIPSESDLYSMVDPGWNDQTVTAVYTPSDATVETVSWSINDQSVATVSGNGKTATVHAVANGSATLTCTATDMDGFSASGTASISVTTS